MEGETPLIQQWDQCELGPCECCGTMIRRVWGGIYLEREPRAVYYATWTPGHADGILNLDLLIGEWAAGSGPDDRVVLSMDCRHGARSPEVMLRNAASRAMDYSRMATHLLTSDTAQTEPFATAAFKMFDAICDQDDRLASWRESRAAGNA